MRNADATSAAEVEDGEAEEDDGEDTEKGKLGISELGRGNEGKRKSKAGSLFVVAAGLHRTAEARMGVNDVGLVDTDGASGDAAGSLEKEVVHLVGLKPVDKPLFKPLAKLLVKLLVKLSILAMENRRFASPLAESRRCGRRRRRTTESVIFFGDIFVGVAV